MQSNLCICDVCRRLHATMIQSPDGTRMCPRCTKEYIQELEDEVSHLIEKVDALNKLLKEKEESNG